MFVLFAVLPLYIVVNIGMYAHRALAVLTPPVLFVVRTSRMFGECKTFMIKTHVV